MLCFRIRGRAKAVIAAHLNSYSLQNRRIEWPVAVRRECELEKPETALFSLKTEPQSGLVLALVLADLQLKRFSLSRGQSLASSAFVHLETR
jgi:hypothetical protein